MQTPTAKGYILTYLGWSLGTAISLGVTYGIDDLLFRSKFPGFVSYLKGTDGDTAFAAAVLGLFAFAIFTVVFYQISSLILVPLLVRYCLKNYAANRRATVIWLFAFLFFAPVILIAAIFINTSFVPFVWITALWLLLSPFMARLIATR